MMEYNIKYQIWISHTWVRNSAGEPKSVIDFLSVGLIVTAKLVVMSKLSSYLRTWPGYSISLLGFHFAGIDTLNPSPAYGKKSVAVFGFPKILAAHAYISSSSSLVKSIWYFG